MYPLIRPMEVVVTGMTNGRNSLAVGMSKLESLKKLDKVSLPLERNPRDLGGAALVLGLSRKEEDDDGVALIFFDNFDEVRNLRNCFRLECPSLESPVKSMSSSLSLSFTSSR